MPALVGSCSPQTLNKRMRGRPFGSKGKASESLRWGFVEAYRQLGGVDGLVKWGRKKPDLFYPMLTKLLPHELAESGLGSQIRVIVYGQTPNTNSDAPPLQVVGELMSDAVEAVRVRKDEDDKDSCALHEPERAEGAR